MSFERALLAGTGTGLFLLALCVLIEHIAPIERYSLKQRIPGFLMGFVGTVLGIGLSWPVGQLWNSFGASIRIPLWEHLRPLGLAGYAVQFLLLVIIADLLAYWRHRAEHSKWLWFIHKVHHAPTELHAANSIGHPLQYVYGFAFITLPMSLFQIDGPQTPFAVGSVVAILALYIHSPIDFHFGRLRVLIVDNRYHRIHHSLEPRHFEKNFGICFSIWDRLFGTAYYPGPDEWPAVGVAGVRPPTTIAQFLKLPLTQSEETPPERFEVPVRQIAE